MPDLSDGVNWSEIDANNNQTPPNGWPEGMMPSGVNDAARADKGALKRFWNKVNPVQYITPSGGVYTFMTASAAYPAAYVNGEIYCFHPTTGAQADCKAWHAGRRRYSTDHCRGPPAERRRTACLL
jgi:hypothetical protein